MKLKLLDILACPKCQCTLICLPTETDDNLEVITGSLKYESCESVYPIRSSIPRFVSEDNYGSSFGFQWNHFKFEQIDACTHDKSSEKRFYSETGWTDE